MKNRILLTICVIVRSIGVLFSNEITEDKIGLIDRWLEESMEYGHIPGVALTIIGNDFSDINRTLGIESPDKSEISNDTQFYIGSLSKTLTAIAILQLVEQQKIDLNRSFHEYLPGVDFNESLRSITVEQLLNQSSGIKNKDGLHFSRKQLERDFSLWSIYPSIEVSLEDVGQFEYSNMNYNILGLIIEMISGERYTEYIWNNILRPLNMKHTVYSYKHAHKLTNGYSLWFNRPVYLNKPDEYNNYLPAMGYISSIDDLKKLLRFLLNPGKYSNINVLSEDSVKEMFTSSLNSDFDGTEGYYGYGWQITEVNGTPCYFIQGGARGSSSYIYILPESNIGIISLTNMNAIFQAKESRNIIPGIIEIINDIKPVHVEPSTTYRMILIFLSLVIILNTIFMIREYQKILVLFCNVFNLFIYYIFMPVLWGITLPAMAFGKPDLFFLMILSSTLIMFTFFKTWRLDYAKK